MSSKRKPGPQRKVNYELVIEHARKNPTAYQSEIANHFKISQYLVSHILTNAGISRRLTGATPKPKPSQSSLEYEWEKTLHDHGLGMDRGLRLAKQRILYGYDVRKETSDDDSATCNPNF